jgi:Holliday junction DNA helicase RuvA
VIALLRGRVAAATLGQVVLDVGGVGYAVRVAPGARVGPQGAELTLHTSLAVREDSLTLYGFPSASARDLFEVLLGVSGVGPKVALAALGTLGEEGLRRAVVAEDVTALTVVGRVVVEAGGEAEAVAQRARDQARPGGGADQRERRQRQAEGPRAGALADDDVEAEILHRRVQHLLDLPAEAVDLIDEQDVARLEVGEDGGQVARALQRGTAGGAQLRAQLGGDDAGEAGLAETRRAAEQQVVGGVPASPRPVEHELELLLDPRLPQELGEAAGPQRRVELRVAGDRRGGQDLVHG